MRDYIKRFLIAIIMALCISLLFLGGKHSEAASLTKINEMRIDWIWPSDGVVSDTYGTRQGKHKGIDIAAKLNTPILAVADGVVVKSYFSNTYGNVVFVKHPNHFVTVYAHLNKRTVSEGQNIKQGKVIGGMGETGQATGSHLHFEAHQLEWRYDKKYAMDPEKLLGKAEVGEVVQGGIAGGINKFLEASSPYQLKIQDREAETKKSANRERYIVKPGDTLFSIAKKQNVSIYSLKQKNKLESDLIKINQTLLIR